MIKDPDWDKGYIAFLVNYFEPAFRLPVEILPGLLLRKATPEEMALFQPYDDAAHLDRGDIRIRRYRISLADVKTETNENFRGYVWQFGLRHWARFGSESHSIYDRLELACSIAESALRPVLVCELRPKLDPYFFTHNLHRHTVLRRRELGNFLQRIPKLTTADLNEIHDVVGHLKELSSQDITIFEAIDRFKQVELISTESDFHTFGLFTVIEYLLTHKPKNEDQTDSVNKQIRAKAPLIARQFDYAVPITKFFEEMSEDKAWKILYAYRSAIAHGGKINFATRSSKNGYAELKDPKRVEAFLYVFTRRLLKAAVRNPKAISDLKRQ